VLRPGLAAAQDQTNASLSQVRAGMQGYAYTISPAISGKFNLEVIGVLDNFLGPSKPSSSCS